MKTIYKYPLKTGLNQLELPYVKILSVINQGLTPTLYAVVDRELDDRKLQVVVCGTGWDLEDNVIDGNFLGTVTDGVFVWHVFYK
jgi:hypothetical protein